MSRSARSRRRPARSLATALAIALALPVAALAGGPTAEAHAPGPVPWSDGEPRPFLAAAAEAGTTQHLRLAAGWGRPWWLWGGPIVDGWVNESMATGTVGARAALLAVNLDVHWRVTRHWRRAAMPVLERHAEIALDGGSTHHAWDLDLWGGAPTPGGFLLWEVLATRLVGLPSDVHVFDEAMHGIVRPPWCGLASLGWVASLRGGDLKLGASADVTHLGRGRDLRWRAGPQISWAFGPRWTLRGQVLFTVAGPDDLALWPSLGGGLLVGYAWATGDRRP